MNEKNVFFKYIKLLIIINILYFILEKTYSNLYKFNQKLPERLFWKNQPINLEKIRKEIIDNNNVNYSLNINEIIDKTQYPKISLVITLFNQEKYILKIYSCIQNQSLEDIEIILVDDNSQDRSYYLIQKIMEKDKRIVYLKNSINKGQFYSRNKGVLESKGEYVLIIDPDDLLLNDILIKSYETANYYKLDIIQYYHLEGSFDNNIFKGINSNGILYQPNVKNLFFICPDKFLWDKLIKRKIFIKSIKFMKTKFKKERFIFHNDETACFGVFRVANSYGLLEQIGYFWNRNNSNSTTHKSLKPENANGSFRSLFSIMYYYFEQSDNNVFEKTKGGYDFFKLKINHPYQKQIKYLTKGFDYIIKVLDLYINSPYFTRFQKDSLQIFKDKIIFRKSQINTKNHYEKNGY